MRFARTVMFMALLTTLPSLAHSRTWYVKADSTGDAPTIRAAIDSAQAGDDVLVGPGTYTWTSEGATGGYGMITMKAGIWLHSEAGPEATTLDAESMATVIWCSGLAQETTIEGFTITGGYRDGLSSDGGGGIHCSESNLTVTGNIIRNNVAQNIWGGAGGGGIFSSRSPNALITNNVIRANSSANYGGGIACWRESPDITFNVIEGNSAEIEGGGVFCAFFVATIGNNTLVGNSSPVGAAIHMEYESSPSIHHNVIVSSLGGAALNCEGDSFPTITCNDLWDNVGGDGNCALGADNFSADPMFCDESQSDYHIHDDSPCAPDNSPAACGLIGALPVACWGAPLGLATGALVTILLGAAGACRIARSRRKH
jgi:hypothetical protein